MPLTGTAFFLFLRVLSLQRQGVIDRREPSVQFLVFGA